MIDLTKYLAKANEETIVADYLKDKENTEIFYDILEKEMKQQVEQEIIALKIANNDL